MTQMRDKANLIAATQRAIDDLLVMAEMYYSEKGFVAGVPTLALGAMEELGEVAQAVLLSEHVTDFRMSEHKKDVVDKINRIGDESGDLLLYVLSLCNKAKVVPRMKWQQPEDAKEIKHDL